MRIKYMQSSPGQTESQVDTSFRLAFRLATHLRQLASTCDDLRGLALTLVELKFERKQTQVFYRLATLRKSVHKFWFCKLASTCESVWPGLKTQAHHKIWCTSLGQGMSSSNSELPVICTLFISIHLLSSFRAPTLWFVDLTVTTCHIQYTSLSL